MKASEINPTVNKICCSLCRIEIRMKQKPSIYNNPSYIKEAIKNIRNKLIDSGNPAGSFFSAVKQYKILASRLNGKYKKGHQQIL